MIPALGHPLQKTMELHFGSCIRAQPTHPVFDDRALPLLCAQRFALWGQTLRKALRHVKLQLLD